MGNKNLAPLILGIVLAAGTNGAAACRPQPATSAQIRWSESKDIRSPNCQWSLLIRPTKPEDGPADVYLSTRTGNVRRLLFKSNRDGTIHWGNGNSRLLVEDKQFSNSYRLLLFDLSKKNQTEADALQINKEIRSDVENKLRPSENIVYYFPKFVAWEARGVIISVGIVVVNGKSGPFTSYCFGYQMGIQPIQIKSTLSEAELKKLDGASCQIWP